VAGAAVVGGALVGGVVGGDVEGDVVDGNVDGVVVGVEVPGLAGAIVCTRPATGWPLSVTKGATIATTAAATRATATLRNRRARRRASIRCWILVMPLADGCWRSASAWTRRRRCSSGVII
jgi:hypothetical protein